MLFIALLLVTTMAVAGSAAYFSVYGLAYTFSGVFWSVVAMGVSLEAGKLIAASYLYRYWNQTHVALKAYLMAGVAALMLLTSVGIFGYLSVGYQQDILPLKQKIERITLLEEEKARVLARKQQIDQLMAGGPTVTNVNRTNGNIDPNAARALRETTRARQQLITQYREEQQVVNARVTELDSELLKLKQESIQAEAKVGPIAYIARAFDLPSDDATKYLIFIIIFAFDPMAVALTLALNNVLRLRREQREKQEREEEESFNTSFDHPMFQQFEPTASAAVEPLAPNPAIERKPQPLTDLQLVPKEDPAQDPTPVVPAPEPEPEPEPEPVSEPQPPVEEKPTEPEPPVETGVRFRPYPRRWTGEETPDKIRELIQHHKYLKARQDNGDTLSKDELWELHSIEEVLRKNGIDLYL